MAATAATATATTMMRVLREFMAPRWTHGRRRAHPFRTLIPSAPPDRQTSGSRGFFGQFRGIGRYGRPEPQLPTSAADMTAEVGTDASCRREAATCAEGDHPQGND